MVARRADRPPTAVCGGPLYVGGVRGSHGAGGAPGPFTFSPRGKGFIYPKEDVFSRVCPRPPGMAVPYLLTPISPASPEISFFRLRRARASRAAGAGEDRRSSSRDGRNVRSMSIVRLRGRENGPFLRFSSERRIRAFFARLRGPCLAGRGLACSVLPVAAPIEDRCMRSWLAILMMASRGGSSLRGIGIYRNFDMLRYSIYYTMENAPFSEWLDRFSGYLRMRNYSPRTIENTRRPFGVSPDTSGSGRTRAPMRSRSTTPHSRTPRWMRTSTSLRPLSPISSPVFRRSRTTSPRLSTG